MNVQATHIFAAKDLQRWLDEHGLDANEVRDLTIHIERVDKGIGAWAHVTWYKRDGRGNRYFDPNTRDAAIGESDVPLRSLPKLSSDSK